MIYIIVFVFLIFQIGFSGNSVLTNLYAIYLEANTLQVGIIVASSALFPMLFAVYAGKVSDRIGFRKPLVFGSFGVSVSFLLPYLIRGQLVILYISQAILGLAFIFLLVNVQNLVGCISTPENRSENYAKYSLGGSTAGIIGPLTAGFSIDHIGYSTTYLIFAMMAAIPGLLIISDLFKLPKIETKEINKDESIYELFRIKDLRKAFFISAIILTGIGIFQFYLPIYGKHIGFSASIIGIILSLYAGAFFVIRLFMSTLMKKMGEELVLIGSLMLATAAYVLIPFFQEFLALAIISFGLGLGLGCGQPLSIVMAYNASPKERTGEALGIRLTVNKIAQFFVPIIFGSIGTFAGFYTVFIITGALLFLGSIYILLNRLPHYLSAKRKSR